mmetsp:Transcript_21346/g.44971  ORF Transcript_21346/g.44971 Transcript_21346/m.44971 type:complete len:120 (+) Transcript_21346:1709-2068(+)
MIATREVSGITIEAIHLGVMKATMVAVKGTATETGTERIIVVIAIAMTEIEDAMMTGETTTTRVVENTSTREAMIERTTANTRDTHDEITTRVQPIATRTTIVHTKTKAITRQKSRGMG